MTEQRYQPGRIFASKVDAWLVAATICPPPIALFIVSRAIPSNAAVMALPVLLSVLLAFSLWVLVTTAYEVNEDTLTVRSGPFSWRIALKDIKRVEDSSDTRTGPALSLDRLKIVYGDERTILVSPRDKAGFRAALKQHE